MLEYFHADLVEIDCGNQEDECVCDMFTAHMSNKKIAEELLAETRSPIDAYNNAIRREKDIEQSKAMKTNPFGAPSATNTSLKQEPMGHI